MTTYSKKILNCPGCYDNTFEPAIVPYGGLAGHKMILSCTNCFHQFVPHLVVSGWNQDLLIERYELHRMEEAEKVRFQVNATLEKSDIESIYLVLVSCATTQRGYKKLYCLVYPNSNSVSYGVLSDDSKDRIFNNIDEAMGYYNEQ